jgi:arginyl-tRNA synthetase
MSFEGRLADDVREAVRRVYGVEIGDVHVERPNDPEHGDFATNVALANARVFRRNPREVAENLVGALEAPYLREAGVAGPGFVNFWLSDEALCGEVGALIEAGPRFGRREPEGKPYMLEYVSANPTGPMHVGHGRQAAFGDSLSRVLEAAGRPVYREYYFNDGGNQIRVLGESVAARYAEIHGKEWPVSDPGALYPGEYIGEIAQALSDERGASLLEMPAEKALREIEAFATRWCMDDIERTLARVRVRFDNFFNEKDLYESGEIEATLSELEKAGHVYESEGALWLDSSKLGDDKDRVSARGTAPTRTWPRTCAYHRNKHERGFATAVDVLGADHAGYPPRIRAGLLALGLPEDFYEVELVRLVKLVREGEQVKFSRRAGNVVTLDELLDEVGEDVARYFYVRSSHRSEINFDLELAVKQSDENPVFYVQYAHARIASIFERAGLSQEEIGEVPAGELAPEERQLVLELLDFPRVIQNAAARREAHPIPTYLETLANRFHQFYTVHRVLVDDPETRARRLALCAATKTVLRTGLDLVGVAAPEKM